MRFILDVIQLFFDRAPFFMENTWRHMSLSLTAIVLSTLLGMTIGIFATRSQWVERVIMSFVNVIYTIPVIAMLGMLIPLVGIGTLNATITLTLYALLPMVRNTFVGINQVDANVKEAALGMGTRDLQMLIKIELPLAYPIIYAGFRNMVVMTIALAGIASMIGAGGLGRGVWRGITTNYDEMIFLSSIMIAFLAGGSDWLLGRMEKVLNRKILGTK